jgi:hypothetical protein
VRSLSARGRARFWVVAVVGLALLAHVAGCRRQGDAVTDVAVTCELSPTPATVGPSTVAVTIVDASGRPVTGATVAIEANMSHPGMSPVFADAVAAGDGRYLADLELTMAGDWILSVSATLADGRTLRKQIDVRGVRAR